MSENLYAKFVKWFLLFWAITISGPFWFIVAGYLWKKQHSTENNYPYLHVSAAVLGGLLVAISVNWGWTAVGLIGFLVSKRQGAGSREQGEKLRRSLYSEEVPSILEGRSFIPLFRSKLHFAGVGLAPPAPCPLPLCLFAGDASLS